MNIGYMFESNENKTLTGINGVINGVTRELLRLDHNNRYYALEDNYLRLPMEDVFIPQLNSLPKSEITDMMSYCNGIGLVHSYFNAFDFMKYKCRRVLTIHDLIPLACPNLHTQSEYFEGPLKKAAKMADMIVADSEYTKKDILKYYGIADDKIQVIYPGFNSRLENNAEETDEQIIEKYGISEGYLLSVCTLEPRKNLKGLTEAFITFKEMHKNNKLKLVLTGKAGWELKVREYLFQITGQRDDIILTGYVEDAVLGALYRNALVVAYVSFYEGFGLPILEAMKYGKAVVCSNTSSMPEVGGNAAIYCNPHERDSIVAALEIAVLQDRVRQMHEEKSALQAQKFSYRKTAEETLELYRFLGAD